MDDLTERQEQVLKFINAFRSRFQCNPTRAEIAEHFGWASPNAAEDHLQCLLRKGVITPRKTRHGWQQKARGFIVVSPYDEN